MADTSLFRTVDLVIKRRNLLALVLVFAVLAAGTLVTVVTGRDGGTTKESTQSASLLPVLRSCVGSPTAQRCITDAFDELQGQLGTIELVNQLFQFRTAEPRATEYCHEVALALGHTGWAEFRDVRKALDAGTPVCASGYLHGVQEAVGEDTSIPTADLIPALDQMCESMPGDTFRVCYHGAGHAVIKRIGQNLQAGLEMCTGFDDVAPTGPVNDDNYDSKYTARELCAEGVTMRYFEPLASAVVAEIPNVRDLRTATRELQNPFHSCAGVVDPSLRWGCFEYASRAYDHTVPSYTRIVDYCNLAPHIDQLPCFFGLSRELAYTPGTDSKHSLTSYCLKAVDPDAAYFCGQNVLLNRITITGDYTTPVEICESLPKSEIVNRICRRVAAFARPNDNESSRKF